MANSTINDFDQDKRIFYDKMLYPDGGIVEMVIWQLAKADAERQDGLKYSLFYGNAAGRVVGYDNERGKGDHRHIQDTELPSIFRSVVELIADFLNDVAKIRGDI